MGAMPAPPTILSPVELEGLVGGGLLTDEVGPLAGRPLVAVALDDAATAHRLAGVVGHLPCVTVAVARQSFAGATGFDVYLSGDPAVGPPWVPWSGSAEEAVAALAEPVAAHPVAALVLVQLLRSTLARTVTEGLIAESLAYATLQSGADHRHWLAERPRRRHREPSPARPGPVVVSREAGRLRVVLDRPEVRNAYDAATRDALVEALRVAAADPGVTEVVIEGSGPDFCSGGDLDEFGTAHDPAVAHGVRSTRHAGASIAACADRCTALVQGACVGAGAELAAFAGRVVAAPGTRFRLPELAMGLVPGAGGTVSIPRRIGSPRTAWLALTGRELDVDTARAWGLVDALVPADVPGGPAPPS
jgi:enoyl-CoA hydratase/carnithine racemase